MFIAVEGTEAFAQSSEPGRDIATAFDGGQLPDQAAILLESESDFRERQRRQGQIMLNVSELGLFRTQKFPSRGQIEKKLPLLDSRSWGGAGRLHLQNFATTDDDLGSFGRITVPLTGRQGKAAHAGDGGDGREIFRALKLAGGMAFQAEQAVIAAHARSIVDHSNQAASASLDFHRDARGSGIERVLDQLLHHACRPFDDLTGGDLIGHLLGQKLYSVHALEIPGAIQRQSGGKGVCGLITAWF